uniref:Uncharacterized protein n=1 Tax=Magnetococcus massalia (strain MO-1) TaxID=451514 RepID=A0A1S7LGT1_MAGMO|nr:protein of unknown function [Candidatus Magnetococcus massalia]
MDLCYEAYDTRHGCGVKKDGSVGYEGFVGTESLGYKKRLEGVWGRSSLSPPRFSSVVSLSVVFSLRRPRMLTESVGWKAYPRRGVWWAHVVYAGRWRAHADRPTGD